MTPLQILATACARHYEHAENIISHETERRFALAQAQKCTKNRDMRGYDKWMDQLRMFTLASLNETSLAGIKGNAKYADAASSVNLIGRME